MRNFIALGLILMCNASWAQNWEDRQQFNGRWLGASCHNEAQLKHAVRQGLDYVTLSPVKHTSSHPETLAMGWDEFAKLAQACPIPVFFAKGCKVYTLQDFGALSL